MKKLTNKKQKKIKQVGWAIIDSNRRIYTSLIFSNRYEAREWKGNCRGEKIIKIRITEI